MISRYFTTKGMASKHENSLLEANIPFSTRWISNNWYVVTHKTK